MANTMSFLIWMEKGEYRIYGTLFAFSILFQLSGPRCLAQSELTYSDIPDFDDADKCMNLVNAEDDASFQV